MFITNSPRKRDFPKQEKGFFPPKPTPNDGREKQKEEGDAPQNSFIH